MKGVKKEDFPHELELIVRAKLTSVPWSGKHIAHFVFQDCVCSVTGGKGEKLGEVAGTVGGGTELRDATTDTVYTINADVFWYAFQEALEALRNEGVA